MNIQTDIPVVLAVSGLDPSGGAGIQADIEALASMGCHTAPIVTALTVQDTRNVTGYVAVDNDLLKRQIETILEDMPVSAVKIGMLGDAGTARVLHGILAGTASIPIVLDPVLVAGGGGRLADSAVRDAMLDLLLPLATIVTPNHRELRALAGGIEDPEEGARQLTGRGAGYVLVTGADAQTDDVVNTLYDHAGLVEHFRWDRIAGGFHGSGCTLASAIAGLIAHRAEPRSAVIEAQEYTWETLNQGYRIGAGQRVPNRLFWALHDRGVGT